MIPHFPLGDDAPYRQAVEAYRRALPPGQVVEFPLTGCDRLGVPVDSVIFYPDEGPHKGGVGYGASEAQAQTGAWGECTEDLWAHQALEGWARERGSYRELVTKFGTSGVVDPLTLCLPAGSPYTPNTLLEWVSVRRYATGENVLIPVEWVACGWSDLPQDGPVQGVLRGRLITPITNGLGAGLSFEQALSHGLLELLQRDGNSVRYRALANGTYVDLSTVTDPASRALLDHYDAQGVDVVVKVAGTDFGITSLYVVGVDRDVDAGASSVTALACGEASHPVAAVALRKALLEFASSRARIAFFHGPLDNAARIAPEDYIAGYRAEFHPEDEEPRSLEAMRQFATFSLAQARDLLSERVLLADRPLSFSDLPTADEQLSATLTHDKGALARNVADRLLAAGFDILVADFSPQDKGVYSLKVIVPGLEIETMSYARLGERNVQRLIEDAGQDGPQLAGVGEMPQGAQHVLLTPEAEARLGGKAWFNTPLSQEVVGPLYCLYREPGRHAVPLLLEQTSVV